MKKITVYSSDGVKLDNSFEFTTYSTGRPGRHSPGPDHALYLKRHRFYLRKSIKAKPVPVTEFEAIDDWLTHAAPVTFIETLREAVALYREKHDRWFKPEAKKR
jgi:hypothetical protein